MWKTSLGIAIEIIAAAVMIYLFWGRFSGASADFGKFWGLLGIALVSLGAWFLVDRKRRVLRAFCLGAFLLSLCGVAACIAPLLRLKP